MPSRYSQTSSGYQRSRSRARVKSPGPSSNTVPAVASSRSCDGVASQSSSVIVLRGSNPSASVNHSPTVVSITWCREGPPSDAAKRVA